MMKQYAVVDIETTGHSQRDDRIIEIGIVLIDDHRIIDTYSTLFNPERSVPTFIENLTGIQEKDLKNAPAFSKKAEKIYSLLKNRYFIAHNVAFDLSFLNGEFKAHGFPTIKPKVIDTVELARILFPRANSFALNALANALNFHHDEPHRALADAYVTAQIFLKMKEKLTLLPEQTIKHLMDLEEIFHSNLQPLLQDSLKHPVDENHFNTFNGITYKPVRGSTKIERKDLFCLSYEEYLDLIYEKNGLLETHLKTFEKRPGQRKMSEKIYLHFKEKKHAMIEGETGLGKSFAYLLPAIYEAVNSKERIVISTLTTSLQTQLLEKASFIQKLIPFSFSVALLKGRGNYLSLERFAHTIKTEQSDNYDIALTKAILLVWITETETGDIDEIQLPASGYDFFNRVSAELENKVRDEPKWPHQSYFYKAYKKAEKADLIITNHALLVIDFLNHFQRLPSYRKAIIDEAHHLEKITKKYEGFSMDYVRMVNFLNQINPVHYYHLWDPLQIQENHPLNYSLGDWIDIHNRTLVVLDELFTNLYQYVYTRENHRLSDIGRIQYRLKKENPSHWNKIQKQVKDFISHMQLLKSFYSTMKTLLEEDQSFFNHVYKDCKRIHTLLKEYNDDLRTFFFHENLKVPMVKWLEIDAPGAKNSVYLFSESINASKQLQKSFFSQKDSIILTSATLAVRESFSYIQKQLGFSSEEITTYQIQSTFSYKDQAQLLIPNDFPHVDDEQFIYAVCEAILSLAHITKGRLLILFTSYHALKEAYLLLREMIMNDEFLLIAQGISSGSRSRLKKDFQAFDQAILLGTNSFWEGVDIPGDDLSSLVIVRLPFQPPTHPVLEAKENMLQKEGKNAFMEYSLPHAVLRFKQGFGRLIRTTKDRGIIFVCDKRLKSSRYSKFFLRSIPSVPIMFDTTKQLMKEAQKWF